LVIASLLILSQLLVIFCLGGRSLVVPRLALCLTQGLPPYTLLLHHLCRSHFRVLLQYLIPHRRRIEHICRKTPLRGIRVGPKRFLRHVNLPRKQLRLKFPIICSLLILLHLGVENLLGLIVFNLIPFHLRLRHLLPHATKLLADFSYTPLRMLFHNRGSCLVGPLEKGRHRALRSIHVGGLAGSFAHAGFHLHDLFHIHCYGHIDSKLDQVSKNEATT